MMVTIRLEQYREVVIQDQHSNNLANLNCRSFPHVGVQMDPKQKSFHCVRYNPNNF